MLIIASVYQTWDQQRRVTLDGVRMVRMEKLNEQEESITRMWQDLAELRLAVDISGRHSGLKKACSLTPCCPTPCATPVCRRPH